MVDTTGTQIATLTATISTLKASIYSGVLRVRINERDTIFRSLAEMKDTLRMAETELACLQPPAFPPRRTRQTRFIPGSSI